MRAEALRDLVDEPGEVEPGVLAGEVGERADLQPGHAEMLRHLGERAAFHRDRLRLELAVQTLPGRFAVNELIAREDRAVDQPRPPAAAARRGRERRELEVLQAGAHPFQEIRVRGVAELARRD